MPYGKIDATVLRDRGIIIIFAAANSNALLTQSV